MMYADREALSESKLAQQQDVLKLRMPHIEGDIATTSHTYMDIFGGVDGHVDLKHGKRMNIQYKTRPEREDGYDDIYIPVKRIFGDDREKIGLKYTSSGSTDPIWFVLDLKQSDIYVFTRADGVTFCFSVDDMHRAFWRYREFNDSNFIIKKKPAADKSIAAITDPSAYILYIKPRVLMAVMLQDWIIATTGYEGLEFLQNNEDVVKAILN